MLTRLLTIQPYGCTVNTLNPPRLAVNNRRELEGAGTAMYAKTIRLSEHCKPCATLLTSLRGTGCDGETHASRVKRAMQRKLDLI
jgi:hypothetical protein